MKPPSFMNPNEPSYEGEIKAPTSFKEDKVKKEPPTSLVYTSNKKAYTGFEPGGYDEDAQGEELINNDTYIKNSGNVDFVSDQDLKNNAIGNIVNDGGMPIFYNNPRWRWNNNSITPTSSPRQGIAKPHANFTFDDEGY